MPDPQPRRVAFVNWTRRHAGGIESYVDFLLSAVADCGYEVALWAEQDSPVDRLPLTVPERASRWCAATDGVEASVSALERWAPSVLLVHGMVDETLEARLLGLAPAVFVAHTYTGTCISGGKTLVFPQARPCDRQFGPACLALFYPRRCGGLSPVTMVRDYRRQMRRLDTIRSYARVLTLSEHMRHEYVRHGFAPDRVRALPAYRPAQPASQSQIDPGPHDVSTLLFLGRMDRLKGCHLLMDALPIVQVRLGSRLRLVIAGDGPDRTHCEERAARVRSSQIEVEFRGWVDAAGRAQALAETDVVVLPSLWPEPYGLSGLEAAATGVPVAAFRVGGIPEWLHEGIGRTAPADPPTAAGLAEAIAGCLSMTRRAPATLDTLRDEQTRHVAALIAALDEAASQAPPTA